MRSWLRQSNRLGVLLIAAKGPTRLSKKRDSNAFASFWQLQSGLWLLVGLCHAVCSRVQCDTGLRFAISPIAIKLPFL